MISLPYIVFALMAFQEKSNEMNIIVAGDPKQIPPVVNTSDKDLEELKIDDENIYKMFGINSFKEEEQKEILRSQDSIDNLNIQYRSIDAIGNLFSQFSYDNLLMNGRDFNLNPLKDLPNTFIDKLKKPISLINFPIDVENSLLTPKKLLCSSYHLFAGILTTELIHYFDKCSVENKKYTIGIIRPYKAQAMLMNKLIVSSGISENIRILRYSARVSR
jgi:superfamily I DNA and/or RNA helicase